VLTVNAALAVKYIVVGTDKLFRIGPTDPTLKSATGTTPAVRNKKYAPGVVPSTAVVIETLWYTNE
jgi:hypothetical protein